MDPSTVVFMIPITAIVLGIGAGIVKSVLSSQERSLEMRLNAQKGQNDEVTRHLQELRAEVAGLRETSHQFDMSFDEALTRLEQRVGHIEMKTLTAVPPLGEANNTLRNGRQ